MNIQSHLKSLSRLFILSACYLLSGNLLSAQSIKIELSEKVIYTDSLNLPRQTNINTVLTMMSELLQRPSEVIYSNYDIQVDDMSVSDASEVALYQLDLEDVERIVISESPTSSYQKNGQGGSINLVLRQTDSKGDALWGSAGLDLSYPMAISPQLHLGYRSKKFYISALALSDIAHPSNNSENLTFVDDKINQYTTTEYNEHYRSQLANVLMLYRPTEKDQFKLNLSESYMYDKETKVPNYDEDKALLDKTRSTTLKAQMSYKHTYRRSVLDVDAQFRYTPSIQRHLTPDVQDLDVDIDNYVVAGKVEYNANLLNPESPHRLKLGIGNSFNYSFGDNDFDYINLSYNSELKESIETHNHTSFVQPFAYAEALFGKFRVRMQSEYQIYRYELFHQNEEFKATSKNFTWQMITEWSFRPNHTLRLFGARELQRPTGSQMFPFSLYDPSNMVYVKGNSDLTPTLTHEIRLDYIANLRRGEHKWHYDVNMSYKHVNDMIVQTSMGGENSSGGLGMTQHYATYHNDGTNKILSGNVMALYSYDAFAISLTGNVFHNDQSLISGPNHYTYFNVSINPHFNLKNGWQGSFGWTYNSSVKTKHSTLSDCSRATTTIGKRWKNLYVYCMTSVTLQKFATDTSWYENIRDENRYEMAPNMAAIGMKYLF